DQIGMAQASFLMGDRSQPAAEPWRPQVGVFAMITLFVVAAAAAAALKAQAPSSPNEVDPLVGGQVEKFPHPAELHAKIRAEPRDLAWAPLMETAIRTRVMQIPLVGKDGNSLRITCAKDLCEIAGTLIAPTPKEEERDRNSQFSRTV